MTLYDVDFIGGDFIGGDFPLLVMFSQTQTLRLLATRSLWGALDDTNREAHWGSYHAQATI